MARLRLQGQLLTLLALMLVPLIVFGDSVLAATGGQPSAKGLDEVFVFRAILSGLCMLVIWLAKKADARLNKLELANQETREKRIEGFARLQQLEDRARVIENDNKQLLSMMNIQQNLLQTKYMDKETMERHWNLIEKAIDSQGTLLKNISVQMEVRGWNGQERRRT